MTTALLSLFAACTNDDFISNEQGIQSGDAAMRPTVDVTLNVLKSNGADTRLAYDFDEGYQWEKGEDVIGALLMDKVIAKKGGQDFRPHDDIEAWEEMPWVDRYALTDYVNTDYPFTLQENGEWKTDAKMLEGNYFFTFPFASYNGNREAIHSIGEQVQDGVTDASLAKAYAKNNFFIGFSRIHAGTEGEEVISSDLEMTPVLGALGVELINTGNQDFTVKKIILQSDAFHTLIKVNPTDANYDGENDADATERKVYNLDNNNLPDAWGTGAFFNYANYEEMVKNGEDWAYAETFEERYNDLSLVNNTKKAYYNEALNYNRQNALRAVIEGITGVDGADNRAELTVENAPVMKANTPGVTQRFVIMTNIYKYTDKTPINLYIYTDKGMVGPVNISQIQSEVDTDGNGKKNVTVITENPIREIAPGIAKKVTLQIDDNSNQGAWGMPIYNESDLAQFIEWNKGTDRTFTATLMNNVTLTKEMSDMLVSDAWATAKLVINTQEGKTGEAHKLILEEGVAKNILDKVLVRAYVDGKTVEAGTIEVKNALELGSNSYVTGTYNIGNETKVEVANVLEVAEGASVTVVSPIEHKTTGNYMNQQLIIAENEGTVTLNAAVAQLQIAENKAEVNINAAATFIGTDGYNSNKNLEGATITIGKGAVVNAAGKLLNNGKNDNPTEEEEANYAVIINNGTLTDFNNGADEQPWGKVIANEGSITNVDNNKGVVEKSVLSAQVSADAEAYEGVISYTVADKKTLKEIIDGKITKLVIDGGEVSGTAYGSSVPTKHYTADKIKWIEVKGKGGSLGSLIENRGAANQNYFTSLFPNLVKVTTKANATFYDVNFGSSEAVAFNIEAATTTIRGWVNSEQYKLDITLGSYDEKNYKGVSATLTLPTTTDRLYAASIEQNEASNDEPSKVINNGFVQLPNGKTPGIIGDDWTGVPAGEKPGENSDKILTETDLTIDEASNYKTLKALKDYLDTFDDISALETITITMGVNMSLDENKGSLDVLAGKDVIVSGGGFYNVSEDMGLKCKSLTVEAGGCIVMNVENKPNTVVLTVESVDYSKGTLGLINSPYIKISKPVQINTGSYVSGGNKITGEGGIVADLTDGTLVWWNQNTNLWTAF